MAYVSKLTIKSQVTVPRDVRAALGVGPGQTVRFDVGEDGRVFLSKNDESEQRTQRRQEYRKRIEGLLGTWADGRTTDEIMLDIRGDDRSDDLR